MSSSSPHTDATRGSTSQWSSTPGVRVVREAGTTPTGTVPKAPKRLDPHRFEAWTVIVLVLATSALSILDLFLLATAFNG
jgi:predicted secreted protein